MCPFWPVEAPSESPPRAVSTLCSILIMFPALLLRICHGRRHRGQCLALERQGRRGCWRRRCCWWRRCRRTSLRCVRFQLTGYVACMGGPRRFYFRSSHCRLAATVGTNPPAEAVCTVSMVGRPSEYAPPANCEHCTQQTPASQFCVTRARPSFAIRVFELTA